MKPGFRSIPFWNRWYKPVVPGSIWEEVVMTCPRACCLPICLTHDLKRNLLMFLQVPQPVSLGRSACPWDLPSLLNHRVPPKNSPLPMQTEPAPYCALWSCIFLPSVLHPSGKAYNVWLAVAKLLPALRDSSSMVEREAQTWSQKPRLIVSRLKVLSVEGLLWARHSSQCWANIIPFNSQSLENLNAPQ